MKTYISILRGINVGGKRSIKMALLKKMLEDLHFKNVQTYIQSGNVVFQYKDTDIKELQHLFYSQIKSSFGFEVPCLIYQLDDFRRIINNNPFNSEPSLELAFVNIIYLSDKPKLVNTEIIHQKLSNEERIAITDRAIYLYCPKGLSKTKVSHSFLEKNLKVTATTRNWKTSNKLLFMAESIE